MIRFILTNGHEYTLTALRSSPFSRLLEWERYDRIFRSRKLPGGTWIFSDLDRLSPWDQELAAVIYLRMKEAGWRVLNNPARVKKRYELLRALHAAGLNEFNAYRAGEIGGGMRFPVFLRKAAGHGMPLSGLMESPDETAAAIETAVASGIPLENLLVIEYAAEPVRPNLFQKWSVFRLGDRMVMQNSVNQSHWLVKYGETGIAGEDLYGEELEMIRANHFTESLRRAFDIAEIEYGRADFGLVGGRIQVYEINTNPTLATPKPHPSPARTESQSLAWRNLLEALRELDTPGGQKLRIRDDRLRPLQRRTLENLLTRTRRIE